ncbi:hypothetical protein OH492_22455 [Vibrio chagasii]|nr:hypothetical protein [Vibrio chagasii]
MRCGDAGATTCSASMTALIDGSEATPAALTMSMTISVVGTQMPRNQLVSHQLNYPLANILDENIEEQLC